MRVTMVLLLAVLAGAGLHDVALDSVDAAALSGFMDQQPPTEAPGGAQQPAGAPTQQDDAEITSAGWANILWLVVVLVAGVAFVWLAMVGLRARSRE